MGRICAELEYLDIREVLDQNMHPFLVQLLLRLNHVGSEIMQTYFNTQMILPVKYPQQIQQQQ